MQFSWQTDTFEIAPLSMINRLLFQFIFCFSVQFLTSTPKVRKIYKSKN
jgi:hypothetical protein